MIDSPTTTQSTPEAVRVLEQAAIGLYREAHPDGVPWQELSDQTRILWVARAEKGAELSDYPPLPAPAIRAAPVGQEAWPFPRVGYYTEDQMRAYVDAARAQRPNGAELKRLAQAAREAYFPSSRHGHPSFDKLDPSSVEAWEMVAAAVIAARGGAA